VISGGRKGVPVARYSLVSCFLLLFLTAAAGASTVAPTAGPEEVLDVSVDPLVAPSGQLVEMKRQFDKRQSLRPLSLVAHRPNYLLVGYYFTAPQTAPFEAQFPAEDVNINPVELKFQLSLKTMLISDLIGKTGDLWVGYTNRSFWQAFNAQRSSPFRETNHEPEAWFDFATDRSLGSLHFKGVNLGMVHQSNGQWGEVSRSWNRIYGLFVFEQGDFYFAVKPWWRLPESRSNDDNPEIEKYLGNFEFYALKKWRDQSLGIMLRNNLRFNSDNHGAVQLDYNFPLHNQLRGYLQYFSGYGESLIDYDHRVNTIGFGVMLSNWL
jgi:phospholipase A1